MKLGRNKRNELHDFMGNNEQHLLTTCLHNRKNTFYAFSDSGLFMEWLFRGLALVLALVIPGKVTSLLDLLQIATML